jgi:hypothetical protein
MNYKWCDEFVRLNPLTGSPMDGDGQKPEKGPVTLLSARNQFASFQVLAGPLNSGSSIRVEAAALKGPRNSSLEKSCFDVYVEWYMNVDDKYYPEILIPQDLVEGSTPSFRKQNDVPKQKYAGFWVDVFVPKGTAPGDYCGELLIRADKETMSVPLSITVTKQTLPAECCLDVSMNNYVDVIGNSRSDIQPAGKSQSLSAKYLRVERNVFREAHENRMFFHYLPYKHSGFAPPAFRLPLAGEGPRKHVTNWKQWDRHFGAYFDGTAFKGTRRGEMPVKRFYMPFNLDWPADFVKYGERGYSAEWKAVGNQIVDHFKEKKWTGTRFDFFLNNKQRYRYFPWDSEEVRFLEDNDVHRYFRTLWEGTYDRKSTKPVKFDYTLGTTWTYGRDIQSDLSEFVDVYIANTNGPSWYKEYLPALHRKGRQIWACTNSGSIPSSTRAPAFTPILIWMRDMDGYMPRWRTTGGWGNDPYRGLGDKGASTLLYPGEEFGSEETFSSLRLKVQRNALQMVDRFSVAGGKRKNGRKAVQQRINRALGITQNDWHTPRPDFVDKKEPKDWVGADFATEEPPLAGWQAFSTDQYRQLMNLSYNV